VTAGSKFLFRKITAYEKQVSFEDEINSRFVKMTLFDFVAIGVIIAANSINKKFYNPPTIAFDKISSPEEFTEFTVEWYRRISFSVTLTITLQIFTPHITNGGLHLIRFLRRFYD